MMMSAVGRKKNTAANTHKLMDDVPLWAAAAIQRGPSTAAMLNRSTSQKPMARRNWDFGVSVSSAMPSIVAFEPQHSAISQTKLNRKKRKVRKGIRNFRSPVFLCVLRVRCGEMLADR